VLAIMKDSRIGAYGVLALVIALGMKVAALATHPPIYGALVLIAAHALSRAYLFATVKALNYARDEKDAKVPPISRVMNRGEVARVAIFALLALLPMLILAAIEQPERLIGAAIALLFAILAMLWVLRMMKARVGGWTGDTLGAQQQAIETAFLVGASAWISI
jgi:adenosylcobinamide-GDP ribazoletransferase